MTQLRPDSVPSEYAERLQAVLDLGLLGLWEVDLTSGRILWTPKTNTSTRLGTSDGDRLPPEQFMEAVHPEDRDRAWKQAQECLASGRDFSMELRLRSTNRPYRWVGARATVIQDSLGVRKLRGIAFDVDDQHAMREALVESERLRELALNAAEMGLFRQDFASGTVLWTDRQYELFDIPAAEFDGRIETVLSRMLPDDAARFEAELRRMIAAREPRVVDEFRVQQRNGSVRWLAMVGELAYTEDGTPISFIGLNYDITARKQHEQALRDSENLRRVALNAANMGAWSMDLVTGDIRWSEEQEALYGLEPGTFDGKLETATSLMDPRDLRKLKRLGRSLRDGVADQFSIEFRIRTSQGELRWLGANGEVIRSEAGAVEKVYGVNYDVTQRKLQQQALADSERLRRLALTAARMGAWEWDMVSQQIRWSPEQYVLFGVSPDAFELRFDQFERLVHPDDLTGMRATVAKALEERGRYNDEYRIVWPDGSVHWIGAVGEFVYDEQKRPNRMYGVNWDITGLKQREEQFVQLNQTLQQKVEDFEALMNAMPVAVAIGEDALSQKIRVNRTFLDLLQVPSSANVSKSSEEGKGMPFRFLRNGQELAPDELPQQMAAMTGEEIRDQELTLEVPGNVHELFGHSVPLFDGSGNVRGSVAAYLDITERKRAEQRALELNALLEEKLRDTEAIVSSIPVGMAFAWSPDCRDIRANTLLKEMLGLVGVENVSASAEQRPGYRVFVEGTEVQPDDLPMQIAARTGQEVRNQELEIRRLDGSVKHLIANAVPMFDAEGKSRGSVGAFLDVTERKRGEDMLRTSEKLATAGRMAASLAHEINNPLAAVTNLLYLIRQDQGLNEASRRFAEMAASEIERVSHITKNILAFYRESNAPVEVSLGDLVKSVLELYAPKIRDSSVTVKVSAASEHRVRAFPGELRQVFSNLIVNAIEAMPKGGLLQVRTHAVRDASGGSRIRIAIADSGCGMKPGAMARIFEPFYTTKGDKGTGLGLWVSRDIIAKHGGSIRVRSSCEPGRSGTCFSVYLPVHGAKLPRQPVAEARATKNG